LDYPGVEIEVDGSPALEGWVGGVVAGVFNIPPVPSAEVVSNEPCGWLMSSVPAIRLVTVPSRSS